MSNFKSVFLNILFLLLTFLLGSQSSKSQTNYQYGFSNWIDLKVKVDNSFLPNPWTGGMNNVQLGQMDINNDGLDDIIVFDRHGNRLLPFIYKDTNGSGWYEFDPYYRKFFPPITDIFQIHDYNNDDKPDIFTYTTGGIMVYKNVSTNQPKFEKAVKQFIKSLQGNIYTNLLVTNVDYPAIVDIDNDTDLDIMTFWGLGSFVELHKNMSIETYGNSDSLLYQKTDYCWGRFAENAESNQILLDTCPDLAKSNYQIDGYGIRETAGERHTGSTLCLIDINQDNVLDLVLGDVDYLNIQGLSNTGTNLNASVTSVIDSFPIQSPVKLASFPSIQQVDIYNDDIQDLIVSPFDPGLTRSTGNHSIWQYNESTSGTGFNKITDSFLQEGTIDCGLGSYPVFAYITNDSLTDLIISNYGLLDTLFYNDNGQLICNYISSVSLYKNTGTSVKPEFQLITNDFNGLSNLKLLSIFPTFKDVNGDLLNDMLLGTSESKFLLFINEGYNGDVPNYRLPISISVQNGETFITPDLEDVNNDGLIDILAGNRNGTLSLYLNTGTLQSPSFNLVTSNYGQINVTDYNHSYSGYSVPSLFRDKQNKLKLLVGSESGKLYYYPELSANFNDAFIKKEDVFSSLNEGIRVSATVSDINKDGYHDMAMGNYGGGVSMFKGTVPGPFGFAENPDLNTRLKIFPNPVNTMAHLYLPNDGEWEILIYNQMGQVERSGNYRGSEIELRLNELRSGLYMIVASQKNLIYTSKLILTQL